MRDVNDRKALVAAYRWTSFLPQGEVDVFIVNSCAPAQHALRQRCSALRAAGAPMA